MKLTRATLLTATLIASGAAPPAHARPPRMERPPFSEERPVVDDYFGTKITDPFRWMEAQPKPEFDNYLHAQDDYARRILAKIPGREKLAQDIAAVTGLAGRVRSVALANGRAIYLKREPGAQIDKLYIRDGDKETMLVDPATLDHDGKHAEIDQFVPSPDASLVVYGLSTGGSENSTLHVIETATGKVRPDAIDRAQFAAASWAPDGKSFFFSRLPASSATAKPVDQYAHMVVFRHTLGDDPAHDTTVLDSDHLPFEFKAAATFPAVMINPGSDYALAVVSDGVSPETTLYSTKLEDLLAAKPAWRKIAAQSDGAIDFAVHGDRIALLTHAGAPRFRIVETSVADPDLAHAATIVPESKAVLTGIGAAKDGLYFAEREGAAFTLHRLRDFAGAPETIALPFAGTIEPGGEGAAGIVTNPTLPGALISLESWIHPHVWLRYDPATGAVADSKILPPFPHDLSAYESRETFATAEDGTKIPLSIVSKKGTPQDGERPTYIVGYGAYGISYDPAFSPAFLPWLDRGGIYAVAHVRGGGEGGQAWHDAGKIATKQNTIHDFIACTEELIKQHYTNAVHLAGEGTSAGGILIGGAITQRPGLYRAALIRVGATNTIREQYTAGGPANIPEFGDVTNKDQFPAMLAMDAYNQVTRLERYPAILLTAGASDPRVTPWIPAKMTAKLQSYTGGRRPILLRVEFDAGHGMGSTRKQRDDETADEFAFLLWQFGEDGYQPTE